MDAYPGCRSLRSLCPGLSANPPSSGLIGLSARFASTARRFLGFVFLQSGSRCHLRGRTAFQANLFFAISYPRALPGVSHCIAFQAKILLLSIALLQTACTSTEKGFCLSFKAARAGGALCVDEDGLKARSVIPARRSVTPARRSVTPARRSVTPARRFVTYPSSSGKFTVRRVVSLPFVEW